MRTKCKLAGLVLALSLAVPVGVSTAPAAQAATIPHVTVTDNQHGFNRNTRGAFVITVHARHDSGANMAGRAYLYVNDRRIGSRPLGRGVIRFEVGRGALPNNKRSAIRVRIDPRNGGVSNRSIVRHVIDRVPRASAGERVVQEARKQVGKPYVYGASGPSSFDCSGLVQHVYREATGKRLPHSSSAIRDAGRRVSRPRAGDIVWTSGHVAIYAGNNKVVEAATPRTDVVYRTMWQSNPVFVRP